MGGGVKKRKKDQENGEVLQIERKHRKNKIGLDNK